MATSVEILMVMLTVGGLVYLLLALWGARDFGRRMRGLRAGVAAAAPAGTIGADRTVAVGVGGGESEVVGFAPAVSILKPVKGVDPRMYAGLASHCRQQYAGEFEIVFGVSSMEDPAVPEIHRLQEEFPGVAIRIVHCTERLGASGKVTNLVQMLRVARHGYVLVNDSDIRVGPRYLERVMGCFGGGVGVVGSVGGGNTEILERSSRMTTGEGLVVGEGVVAVDPPKRSLDGAPGLVAAPGVGGAPGVEGNTSGVGAVGMVTAPYLGRTPDRGAGLTVWARLEALGISTDFVPGVLAARKLEGGIRFGLGSTLAMSREALEAAGGMAALVNSLADDYELGARIAAAGYRVELAPEVVETSVPGYGFRGFWEHQLRWARSTRDSRRWGYVGLGITYAVPWALLTCVASGFALWSFSLLSLVLLARVAVALGVGVGILNDGQVLRDLWLLPARDCVGLLVWAWSFASDTVVWRGERFRLRAGSLTRLP